MTSDEPSEYQLITTDLTISANIELPDTNHQSVIENLVLSCFYTFIFIAGLFGNLLTAYVVVRKPMMRTVTNRLILNLALSDSFFMLTLPFIVVTSLKRNWVFGTLLCKAFYAINCVNIFSGSFTLAILSADRFAAVCFPLVSVKLRTPGKVSIAIGLSWLLSVLATYPVVHYATVSRPEKIAIDGNPVLFAYIVYSFIIGFFIPMIAIIVFYSLLVASVTFRRAKHRHMTVNSERRHKKITKLVTSVIIVYVVCWLPYYVFQFALLFDGDTFYRRPWTVYLYYTCNAFTYLHSVFNPLLYAVTNKNFQDAFKETFSWCYKRRPIRRNVIRSRDLSRSKQVRTRQVHRINV
ncbi:hypothetical protein HELRODRAFT_82100 [Helobdella robusta]|uniref:G-protein coupled receptors family 1 profile domain-containing protein n=1 Tax=Helobdella robusta TaxID=6412 RepID=T1G4M7_HELRO|nr:hypothetical protein HELRODRAFT_82100 [Helobdella robusta]ESO01438.1 hypothetical protein HELRODRAFT_82100 [Helobdella robusta]